MPKSEKGAAILLEGGWRGVQEDTWMRGSRVDGHRVDQDSREEAASSRKEGRVGRGDD
jgi:hypothetical protein